MRLRRPCEHVDAEHREGHYEPHYWVGSVDLGVRCPGGEFLPEDAVTVWWCSTHSAAGHLAFEDVCDVWALGNALKEDPRDPCSLSMGYVILPVTADQVGEPGQSEDETLEGGALIRELEESI